ncbi:MAG: hypothetical protein EBQ73_03740, partial [Gammaproteobacteria bacterium]|nr:hypothetical protein [Gammaproteobacteria bacterium]
SIRLATTWSLHVTRRSLYGLSGNLAAHMRLAARTWPFWGHENHPGLAAARLTFDFQLGKAD